MVTSAFAVYQMGMVETAAAAIPHLKEILQQLACFTWELSKGQLALRPLKGLASLNK